MHYKHYKHKKHTDNSDEVSVTGKNKGENLQYLVLAFIPESFT